MRSGNQTKNLGASVIGGPEINQRSLFGSTDTLPTYTSFADVIDAPRSSIRRLPSTDGKPTDPLESDGRSSVIEVIEDSDNSISDVLTRKRLLYFVKGVFILGGAGVAGGAGYGLYEAYQKNTVFGFALTFFVLCCLVFIISAMALSDDSRQIVTDEGEILDLAMSLGMSSVVYI
jgi:hypothetical protein